MRGGVPTLTYHSKEVLMDGVGVLRTYPFPGPIVIRYKKEGKIHHITIL